jgi:hypothetical protein
LPRSPSAALVHHRNASSASVAASRHAWAWLPTSTTSRVMWALTVGLQGRWDAPGRACGRAFGIGPRVPRAFRERGLLIRILTADTPRAVPVLAAACTRAGVACAGRQPTSCRDTRRAVGGWIGMTGASAVELLRVLPTVGWCRVNMTSRSRRTPAPVDPSPRTTDLEIVRVLTEAEASGHATMLRSRSHPSR